MGTGYGNRKWEREMGIGYGNGCFITKVSVKVHVNSQSPSQYYLTFFFFIQKTFIPLRVEIKERFKFAC